MYVCSQRLIPPLPQRLIPPLLFYVHNVCVPLLYTHVHVFTKVYLYYSVCVFTKTNTTFTVLCTQCVYLYYILMYMCVPLLYTHVHVFTKVYLYYSMYVCSQRLIPPLLFYVYRIALIFRGSKFSRIAGFFYFVEIISRMRCSIRRQCGSTLKCQNIR